MKSAIGDPRPEVILYERKRRRRGGRGAPAVAMATRPYRARNPDLAAPTDHYQLPYASNHRVYVLETGKTKNDAES